MAKNYLPPVEFLRECFSYDPDTGEIRWRRRPPHHFNRAQDHSAWNTRYANTKAGNFNGNGIEIEFTHDGASYSTRAHRIAYALINSRTDFGEIDHVNGDTTDNRPGNIRLATRSQNNSNRYHRNKTLPKGVYMHRQKFVAEICAGRKKRHLGVFDTPAEAHAAYCAAGRELHGEFFNAGPPRPSVFD